MKGTILTVSDNEILIRCNENNKYTAQLFQIKSTDVKPKAGDTVDFEVTDGGATDVYILRAASALEGFAKLASNTASSVVGNVKAQINDENKDRIKAMAANASQAATKIGGDLKSKATEFAGNMNAGNGVSSNLSGGIQNKFSIAALAALLVLSFFSLVSIMGTGFTFYELTDSYKLAIFLVVAIGVAALGVNAIVYRVITAIVLLIVLLPISDAISALRDGAQMMSGFGFSSRKADPFKVLFEVTTFGFFLFIISAFMVAITLIPGIYKAKAVTQDASH